MNNNHKNARITVYIRELMIKRVMNERMSASGVALQFRVSRRTVYTWLNRYKQGGWQLWHTRSSKPLHSPKRMSVEQVATIAAMRRMRMTGPAIAYSLSLPLSTVGLELRRLGLNKLSRLDEPIPVLRVMSTRLQAAWSILISRSWERSTVWDIASPVTVPAKDVGQAGNT